MTKLIANRYGKGRVRVARVRRAGPDGDEVRDLSVETMLEGDFGRAYTDADNAEVVATDTVKNMTNIVAHEQLGAATEVFAAALAERLLRYPQVARVVVRCTETKWVRAVIGGVPHPHSFVLDSNGRPVAAVDATRDAATTTSGIDGFTFMKSTEAGWVGFHRDENTTLPETTDRIVATAMDARWRWRAAPADYPAANAAVLDAMLREFATTYSFGVQDSLFRMAGRALEAVPAVETITLACPNKHYLPLDLGRFGLATDNSVFTPTDEPHGQIECTVGRD